MTPFPYVAIYAVLPTGIIEFCVLQEKYSKDHAKGGRKPKLTIRDRLCAFLIYYREYRTMENIAIDYNVTNSTLCDAIHWTEETLVKSGLFTLPSKRSLCEGEVPDVILIDATECETERPKKATQILFRKKEKAYAESTVGIKQLNRGYFVCFLCKRA